MSSEPESVFLALLASTTFKLSPSSAPLSHLLPVIKRRELFVSPCPAVKVFIVSKQLFEHLPHLRNSSSTLKDSNWSNVAIFE